MTSRRGVALLSLAVLAAVAVSGWATVTARDDHGSILVEGTSAEAGFAQDMAVHHSQAVAMAEVIHARTDDPMLATLASDIALGQQSQSGRFYGWLEQWGLPATNRSPMAWMTDNHETMQMEGTAMAMPGLATREQLQALSDLPVADAEAEFLRLMIEHHRGGVEMAEAVLDRSDRSEVLAVAEAIVAGQTNEIDVMNQMLIERDEPTR